MAYRREGPKGGKGWFLVFLAALTLLIAYGGSQPIVELRESILALWQAWDYEEALETLGRSFTGETGEAVAVFGRQILGFGE